MLFDSSLVTVRASESTSSPGSSLLAPVASWRFISSISTTPRFQRRLRSKTAQHEASARVLWPSRSRRSS